MRARSRRKGAQRRQEWWEGEVIITTRHLYCNRRTGLARLYDDAMLTKLLERKKEGSIWKKEWRCRVVEKQRWREPGRVGDAESRGKHEWRGKEKVKERGRGREGGVRREAGQHERVLFDAQISTCLSFDLWAAMTERRENMEGKLLIETFRDAQHSATWENVYSTPGKL